MYFILFKWRLWELRSYLTRRDQHLGNLDCWQLSNIVTPDWGHKMKEIITRQFQYNNGIIVCLFITFNYNRLKTQWYTKGIKTKDVHIIKVSLLLIHMAEWKPAYIYATCIKCYMCREGFGLRDAEWIYHHHVYFLLTLYEKNVNE